MTKPTKPILHNGFNVRKGLTVNIRLERTFFTEVYELSDGKFLYLFTDIRPEEVVDRNNKYDLISVHHDSKKYLGVIIEEHSHERIAVIKDDLTVLRGFDCVAGMKELKTLLINEVIDPLLNPEKFKKFKLSIPNGILLYGPPGCGKTFIVKKLSEELEYNYIELNPSSVATPYVHGAVGNIAKVFEMAKLRSPTIVFIDEIEGLLPKRENLGSHAETKKEEINEFLLQLNNAGASKILVVGATNRPQMIDSAILRSGRMDKRVYVPPPDFEARKEMFRICLSGRPYDKEINFETLAEMTGNDIDLGNKLIVTKAYVSSDIELIVTEAARMAVARDKNAIDEKIMIEAVQKFTPSISLKEIASYDQFANLERW